MIINLERVNFIIERISGDGRSRQTDSVPAENVLATITDYGLSLMDDADAAEARNSLGGTVVGQSFFTLPNPSAIRFPRINADNTVSALSAASFLSAIGGGGGGGGVTPDEGQNILIGGGGTGLVIDLITITGDDNIVIGGNSVERGAMTGSDLAGAALTYAEANILIGSSAGRFITNGGYNIVIGESAYTGNGFSNVAIGGFSMDAATTGNNNTAVGDTSLRNVTTGHDNVSVGQNSGGGCVTGEHNLFCGASSDTTKSDLVGSIAIGYGATVHNNYQCVIGETGSHGVILGFAGSTAPADADIETTQAFLYWDFSNSDVALKFKGKAADGTVASVSLWSHDAGQNVFIGGGGKSLVINAGAFTGCDNIVIGGGSVENSTETQFAGIAMTDAEANILIGASAGKDITTGSYNIAIGESALAGNGVDNICIGGFAMQSATTATSNTAVGDTSLGNITTGTHNNAYGYHAGGGCTVGTYNLFLGDNSTTSKGNLVGSIAIGHAATVHNDHQCVIGDVGAEAVVLGFAGVTAPADADIETTQAFFYWDFSGSDVVLKFKGKASDGTVVTKTVATV